MLALWLHKLLILAPTLWTRRGVAQCATSAHSGPLFPLDGRPSESSHIARAASILAVFGPRTACAGPGTKAGPAQQGGGEGAQAEAQLRRRAWQRVASASGADAPGASGLAPLFGPTASALEALQARVPAPGVYDSLVGQVRAPRCDGGPSPRADPPSPPLATLQVIGVSLRAEAAGDAGATARGAQALAATLAQPAGGILAPVWAAAGSDCRQLWTGAAARVVEAVAPVRGAQPGAGPRRLVPHADPSLHAPPPPALFGRDQAEAPGAAASLARCGSGVAAFVLPWLRSGFTGLLPPPDATLALALALLHGPEVLAFVALLALRRLEPYLMRAAQGGWAFDAGIAHPAPLELSLHSGGEARTVLRWCAAYGHVVAALWPS